MILVNSKLRTLFSIFVVGYLSVLKLFKCSSAILYAMTSSEVNNSSVVIARPFDYEITTAPMYWIEDIE